MELKNEVFDNDPVGFSGVCRVDYRSGDVVAERERSVWLKWLGVDNLTQKQSLSFSSRERKGPGLFNYSWA